MQSCPTAGPSVSISSPRGRGPSIRSHSMTIPSERPPSERPMLERTSMIITDDPNRHPQYLHRLEADGWHHNHDHLGEIQDGLCGLARYIHDMEARNVLPPVRFKGHSVDGRSVVSPLSPRKAPLSIPPTVTGNSNPCLVPIPFIAPPHSPRSPII
jgi:hypothetical protein